jgi:hypothetical protein
MSPASSSDGQHARRIFPEQPYDALKAQRSKQIFYRFPAAYQGKGAVGAEQDFGAAEFAVVVKTHSPAVSAGIVYNK